MATPDRQSTWAFRCAVGFILLLAAGLRLACLDTEFWFDEVWSREFADTARQPWDILIGPDHHHDNNHKLNTLILWFTPGAWPFWAQRLHSFAAGLAIVALGMRWARQWGRPAALLAGLMLACNFWQVLHSCEARGYALAGALALAAVLLQERLLRSPQGYWLPVFWVVCLLGMLAHLLFAHLLLGLGVWALLDARQCSGTSAGQGRVLLRLFGVPLLGCWLLYLVDVRWMVIGGPPALDPQVLGSLFGTGWGLPPAAAAAFPWWLALSLATLVLAAGCRIVPGPQRGFLVTTIVLAPALMLALQPPILFERYFYIAYLFWLIMQSVFMAQLSTSTFWRICVLMVTFMLLAMSAGQAALMRQEDRGAMRRLGSHWCTLPPGAPVTVTSDSDWRTSKLLDFYTRSQGLIWRKFVYIKAAQAAVEKPAWLLLQWPAGAAPGRAELQVTGGRYRLDAAFPVGVPANAGWGWLVYKLVTE